MPGVSIKIICESGLFTIAFIAFLVVCGLFAVAATFSPTNEFIMLDFPTLVFLLLTQNLISYYLPPHVFVCLSSFYLLIGKHCYLFYYTPIILKSLSNFVNKLIFLTKYCTFLFCYKLYEIIRVLYVLLEHLYIHYIFVLILDFHVIFLFDFFIYCIHCISSLFSNIYSCSNF